MAEGSVEQALKEKHYKRGVHCLKLVYELLTRKIIQSGFENGLSISPDLQAKLQVLRRPGEHTKDELCDAYRSLQANPEISRFVEAVFAIVEQAGSSMTTYWLSFMEMVEVLLLNIHALRTQDWDAFKCSLRMMLPWLQIYDNNKYGRWLTEFWLEISSLPDDKAQYMYEGLFSQSMTGQPYSCLPLDLWIEMTMNKGSKMKAEWSHFLKKEPMLLIHTRTVNFINRVRVSLHVLATLNSSAKGHVENSSSRLAIDEQAIHDMDQCLTEFASDPFDLGNTTLRSLQSG